MFEHISYRNIKPSIIEISTRDFYHQNNYKDWGGWFISYQQSNVRGLDGDCGPEAAGLDIMSAMD